MKLHIHRPNADAKIMELKSKLKEQSKAPKFCKDCHWHHFEQFPKKEGYAYKHFCTYPPMLDLITGLPSIAIKCRNTETLCGRSARHFTQRQK